MLGETVFLLVGERDGHHDLSLGRQLREHVGFQPAHEAAELSREASARSEVLEPADHPQLRDQLVGVVEHRCPGQGEAQAVGGDGAREPADRLGALGARVLAVVGLVDDQGPRPGPGQGVTVGSDDLVIEDRDLAGGWDRWTTLHDHDGPVG